VTIQSMDDGGEASQLILRAELFHKGRHIVGHTMEVTAVSALVRTDEPLSTGDRLLARLSFPGLLEPFDVEGHVASTHLRSAAGPAGVTLVLVFTSDREEALFRQLVEHGSAPIESQAERVVYRVLLVEDNPTVRDLLLFEARRHFRGERQIVLDLAADGEEAWQMLESTRYHLAIVDYFLPGMNGAELVERIRAEAPIAGMPVVAMSVGGPAVRNELLSAGADVFLDKPVGARDLFTTLDRLLARLGQTPRQRILLVDDSLMFLEMVGSALDEAGFHVLQAASMLDVDRLISARPDLVLMDVRMPEAYGDELAAMLRGMRGIQVPIYLLSSLKDEELRRRAEEAEVDGYISKDRGIPHLVERVRSILRGPAPAAAPAGASHQRMS
jgi:DNA-binding response OmpR family regulator